MESQEQLEDIKRIRSLMERSTMYRSLSGLSGIAAGITGIAVYFIVYAIVDPKMEHDPQWKLTDEGKWYFTKIFLAGSTVALLLAFTSIFYFNWRKAQQYQLPFFDAPMQRMFINLFIPLIAGGIYCLMLLREEQFLLIAPTMLVFYGLAMILASRHTIIEIRYLGMVELMLGLISIFFKEYGSWFWLIGFGFVNLIYGVYIYWRYERTPEGSHPTTHD
jgi:hypothetical protein